MTYLEFFAYYIFSKSSVIRGSGTHLRPEGVVVGGPRDPEMVRWGCWRPPCGDDDPVP